MLLGLAFGFAMVGVLLRIGSLITSIPTQEIYVLFMSTEVFCTPVLFGGLAHSTELCWALSNQKRMSYLAKKEESDEASVHRA